MTKFLFIIFCLLVLSLNPFQVQANSLKDFGKNFHRLNSRQQKEFVKIFVNYMVELEKNYEHEVTQNSSSKQINEAYALLKKQVSYFLLSNAYAVSNSSTNWQDYASAFKTQFENGNDGEICFFAGWVSKMQRSSRHGRAVCAPPKNLPANDPLRKEYERLNQGTCKSSEISCNPAIFGFKQDNSELICVDARSTKSQNASQTCLEKVGSPSADLINNFKNHPEFAQYVFEKMFKSCICEINTADKKLNNNYLNAIRPHQTCNSLVQVIGQLIDNSSSDGNTCLQTSSQPISQSEWSQFAFSDPTLSMNIAQDQDSKKREFDKYKSAPGYDKICGSTDGLPNLSEYTCSLSNCSKGSTKEQYSCKAILTKDGSEQITVEVVVGKAGEIVDLGYKNFQGLTKCTVPAEKQLNLAMAQELRAEATWTCLNISPDDCSKSDESNYSCSFIINSSDGKITTGTISGIPGASIAIKQGDQDFKTNCIIPDGLSASSSDEQSSPEQTASEEAVSSGPTPEPTSPPLTPPAPAPAPAPNGAPSVNPVMPMLPQPQMPVRPGGATIINMGGGG